MTTKPPKPTDRPAHPVDGAGVAELDNCSEKTVRRAIAASLLEAVRLGPGGRLLRIDPAAHALYRQRLRQ